MAEQKINENKLYSVKEFICFSERQNAFLQKYNFVR